MEQQESTTPPPAEDLVDIKEFARIKLRIGQIVQAEAVPDATKLLKMQVDLGAELGTRQLVAGIAQHYTPESLVGRKIVVVVNLKPARIRGVESQGMLLAASDSAQGGVVLLQPERDLPPGSEVR